MTNRTLQELFVDRAAELDKFRRSLSGGRRRIIIVTAGSGMGKSWLLRQFAEEAQAMGAGSVTIDFSDGQAYDVLMLVRRFRDSLGGAYFNRLTAAINEATAPRIVLAGNSAAGAAGSGVDFGSANQFGNVTMGDVAGRDIIKDNLFIVQSDNPLLLQALEDRITLVFFECLTELSRQRKLVFFFDTYERNSLESERWVANAADRWIMRELLTRIRDGGLTNTLAVLAGRRLPDFGVEWRDMIGELKLGPFKLEDVRSYLRDNRGMHELSEEQVQALFGAVQGNPQLLGIIGDNLEQTKGKSASDDEW